MDPDPQTPESPAPSPPVTDGDQPSNLPRDLAPCCAFCRYELTGLPNPCVCPECGRANTRDAALRAAAHWRFLERNQTGATVITIVLLLASLPLVIPAAQLGWLLLGRWGFDSAESPLASRVIRRAWVLAMPWSMAVWLIPPYALFGLVRLASMLRRAGQDLHEDLILLVLTGALVLACPAGWMFHWRKMAASAGLRKRQRDWFYVIPACVWCFGVAWLIGLGVFTFWLLSY